MFSIVVRFRYFKALDSRCLIMRQYSKSSGSSGERRGSDGILSKLWNSWIPIPAGLGLTVLAILQWRRIQRRNSNDLKIAKDWQVDCYRALPLRSMSRAFGWVTGVEVPPRVRPSLYSSYSRVFGVNTAEISMPFDYYASLSDFFCRQLKEGCRPIDKHDIVSPADGRVLTIGKVDSCRLEQVKGVTYNIEAFLGPAIPVTDRCQYIRTNIPSERSVEEAESEWSRYRSQLIQNDGNDLYQIVVYLGPGDYHRFHSPADLEIFHRRHFQGELLSVSPRIAGWVPGLFTLNERAVYFGRWRHGYFSFTAVGATNVGSIRVHKDQTLHTNQRKWRDGTREREAECNFSWKKGEDIGEFRLGSTVVLIFEAPPGLELGFKPGDRVKVGQTLLKLNGYDNRATA